MPVLLSPLRFSEAEAPNSESERGGEIQRLQTAIQSLNHTVAELLGYVDPDGTITLRNADVTSDADAIIIGDSGISLHHEDLRKIGYELKQQEGGTNKEVQYSTFEIMMPVGITLEGGCNSLLTACGASANGFESIISNLAAEKRGDKYAISCRVSDAGDFVVIGDLKLSADIFWDALHKLGWL